MTSILLSISLRRYLLLRLICVSLIQVQGSIAERIYIKDHTFDRGIGIKCAKEVLGVSVKYDNCGQRGEEGTLGSKVVRLCFVYGL